MEGLFSTQEEDVLKGRGRLQTQVWQRERHFRRSIAIRARHPKDRSRGIGKGDRTTPKLVLVSCNMPLQPTVPIYHSESIQNFEPVKPIGIIIHRKVHQNIYLAICSDDRWRLVSCVRCRNLIHDIANRFMHTAV